MINFKTTSDLLIKERETAREYLKEILAESEHVETIIDDLLNMTEGAFKDTEVNEQNIRLAYEKLYSADLIKVLPAYLLKVKLTIVK